jgi:hypothetical protein
MSHVASLPVCPSHQPSPPHARGQPSPPHARGHPSPPHARGQPSPPRARRQPSPPRARRRASPPHACRRANWRARASIAGPCLPIGPLPPPPGRAGSGSGCLKPGGGGRGWGKTSSSCRSPPGRRVRADGDIMRIPRHLRCLGMTCSMWAHRAGGGLEWEVGDEEKTWHRLPLRGRVSATAAGEGGGIERVVGERSSPTTLLLFLPLPRSWGRGMKGVGEEDR